MCARARALVRRGGERRLWRTERGRGDAEGGGRVCPVERNVRLSYRHRHDGRDKGNTVEEEIGSGQVNEEEGEENKRARDKRRRRSRLV